MNFVTAKRDVRDRSSAPARLVLLAAAFALCAAAAQAEDASLGGAIRAALKAIPHAQATYGVCVVELGSGKTVFEAHADRLLVPASVMKTFVMAAALERLGPAFAFETHLATDGKHLYLIGSGDPALGDPKLCANREESVTAVFERWASLLVAADMPAIPGDLIVDESIFDDQRVHPSWEDSDLGKWYAAPVAGLNFHDNCVDITLEPGSRPGDPTIVSTVPDCPSIQVHNKSRTGAGSKPLLHHPVGSFDYRISGHCAKRWLFPPVAFPDPALLGGDALRIVLAKNGVSIGGGLVRERVRLPDGSIPSSLRILATHRTPLSDVLGRIGKNSQNLFAECVLKRLGYEWEKKRGADEAQGSWASGGRALRDALEAMGLDTSGMVISDGSGLSRDNRCSARQLAGVLALVDRSPHREVMRASLSLAGTDGSLRKRLRDLPGRVRGKTGTMRGVRALCGYVDGSSSNRYAFAIIFNGYRGSAAPYKEIQDRICRVLAKR